MRPILSVLNVLGALLMLFSGYYVLPLATALVYGEAESLRVFALCAGITLYTPLKRWGLATLSAVLLRGNVPN